MEENRKHIMYLSVGYIVAKHKSYKGKKIINKILAIREDFNSTGVGNKFSIAFSSLTVLT